jgi:hypothetical protein
MGGGGGHGAVARVGRWIGPPSAPTTIQIADRDVQPQRTDARHGSVEAPLAKWPLSHASYARAAASAPTRLRLLCSTRNYSRDRTRTSPARITRPGGGDRRNDADPECRRTGCPAASSPLHPRVPNHHHRRCARYHDSSPFARLGGDRRVSSTWLGATGTNQLTDESYKQQWSPQTCQQPSSRMNPVCNLQTQMVLISASQPRR